MHAIEPIIISLGLKLPTRTRYRGSLQSRLELVMDRHDLTTHEGNGLRWKYPGARLISPSDMKDPTGVLLSLTHIQSTQSFPGDGRGLLTCFHILDSVRQRHIFGFRLEWDNKTSNDGKDSIDDPGQGR